MNRDVVSKYQKKILTIPNILSFFRLCLIPLIVWLYNFKKDYSLTLAFLLLSGITDIADGIIARQFNMISDFGKVFDPIADKLTQLAMLFCLASRFPHIIVLFTLLVVKEIFTGITAVISIKRTKTVKGAAWHGKMTTVSLYTMIGIHLLWHRISYAVSRILVGICIVLMLMSFTMYVVQNIRAIKNKTFDV